ncbi:flippase [Orenia marismortui]|uniref:O-antigen/teichoic acid export membrane protein n=1 Tax=Orenia marismortui TaxID=46469 RepID=A0A4R8HR32_9FIRM|nr:flippase [Orenia marismortui]TDX59273.1 O-antigen/teichoic acid export membrane protein [Orenia marismortui]
MNFIKKYLKSNRFINFISIFCENVLSKIVILLINLYIANYFGKEVFGIINFSKSLSQYLFLFSTLGLGKILLREVIKDKKNTRKYIFNITLIRIIIAIIILILGMIFLTAYNRPIRDRIIILLYLITAVFMNLDIYQLYDIFDLSKVNSAIKSLQNIIYLLVVVVLINFLDYTNLMYIVIAYSVINIIYYLFSWFYFYNKIGNLQFEIDFLLIKELIIKSIPVAIARIMAQIYNNMDIVMLGFLKGNIAVGIYAAAYNIIFGIKVLNIATSRIIIPEINKSLKEGKKKIISTLRQAIKLKSFYALPITLGGIALSDKIILLLFNSEYSEAGLVLKILLLWISISIFTPIGSYLFATGQDIKYLIHIAIGGIVNILLNFYLIPEYSFIGAAIATIISGIIVELVKVIMCIELIRELSLLEIISKFLVTSLIMYFSLILLQYKIDNLFILIVCGVSIYLFLNKRHIKDAIIFLDSDYYN